MKQLFKYVFSISIVFSLSGCVGFIVKEIGTTCFSCLDSVDDNYRFIDEDSNKGLLLFSISKSKTCSSLDIEFYIQNHLNKTYTFDYIDKVMRTPCNKDFDYTYSYNDEELIKKFFLVELPTGTYKLKNFQISFQQYGKDILNIRNMLHNDLTSEFDIKKDSITYIGNFKTTVVYKKKLFAGIENDNILRLKNVELSNEVDIDEKIMKLKYNNLKTIRVESPIKFIKFSKIKQLVQRAPKYNVVMTPK